MNNNWRPPYPHPNEYWQHNRQNQGFNHNWQPGPMPNWNRQITIREAMDIAEERVPGEIVKVELDREKGMLVYEVDIRTGQGITPFTKTQLVEGFFMKSRGQYHEAKT